MHCYVFAWQLSDIGTGCIEVIVVLKIVQDPHSSITYLSSPLPSVF